LGLLNRGVANLPLAETLDMGESNERLLYSDVRTIDKQANYVSYDFRESPKEHRYVIKILVI
jgi:hypothetical protein